MKILNYIGTFIFLAFMGSSDFLTLSRQPTSIENSLAHANLEDEKTLATLNVKYREQFENVKALNELNRPGRSPVRSQFKQKKKPILPLEGVLKTPDSLVEILGYLEAASDFAMLMRRSSEVWNFNFFVNLEGGPKFLEKDEALMASMFNIETYVAFSVWVQIHDVEAVSEEKVYLEVVTQLGRYKKLIAENRILASDRNDLVESVEQTLKAEIKRKVFSSVTFKTFLKKVRVAGKGMKVMGSVGAVTSLIDLISEYANFYSESEALRAELQAVNVPHDRIVRIVIR